MLRRSCDQSVVDGQGTLLDIDLVALLAPLALGFQLVLMGGVEDRQPASEQTGMPSG